MASMIGEQKVGLMLSEQDSEEQRQGGRNVKKFILGWGFLIDNDK